MVTQTHSNGACQTDSDLTNISRFQAHDPALLSDEPGSHRDNPAVPSDEPGSHDPVLPREESGSHQDGTFVPTLTPVSDSAEHVG